MRTYGEMELRDGVWHLEMEAHALIRFKRMFPRVKARGTKMQVKHTLEVARDLVWFLERYPMRMSDLDSRVLCEQADQYFEQTSIVDKILAGQAEVEPAELALPLRGYQRLPSSLCLASGSLLLADELGLGKTPVAISVLAHPAARPALVVTMTHLPLQWQRELQKFTPSLTSHVLTSGKPYDLTKRSRAEKAMGLRDGTPDVIITNYHKLDGWAPVLQGLVKSVAFDEIQELRHDSSQKYTAASAIAEGCRYKIGLSATPMHNWGIEMFNVLDVLHPGRLGTREEFIREWCSEGLRHTSIREPKAFGAYVRESGMMLRRTRRDVGRELPPISNIIQYVEADTSYLDNIQSAAEELAKVILQQGGAGFAKMKAAEELDWRLRQATGLAKAPYVAEVIRMLVESGEKVVVFAWHREVYGILHNRLSDYKPAMYTGTESVKQKDESRRRFIDGETPILLMSLRAGAGLDGLQHVCRTVVFAELDWSPAVHWQDTGRVARDGQTDPVMAYYLLSNAGSDPILIDILQVKNQQIGGVIDPNAPIVETIQMDPDRIKKLAEGFLRQKGLAA